MKSRNQVKLDWGLSWRQRFYSAPGSASIDTAKIMYTRFEPILAPSILQDRFSECNSEFKRKRTALAVHLAECKIM